jgi:hypothetical protein
MRAFQSYAITSQCFLSIHASRGTSRRIITVTLATTRWSFR